LLDVDYSRYIHIIRSKKLKEDNIDYDDSHSIIALYSILNTYILLINLISYIQFFGDGMIEQLSGSRGLGVNFEEGTEEYFERQFTRKNGGKFNAIALGSSGDTVC